MDSLPLEEACAELQSRDTEIEATVRLTAEKAFFTSGVTISNVHKKQNSKRDVHC